MEQIRKQIKKRKIIIHMFFAITLIFAISFVCFFETQGIDLLHITETISEVTYFKYMHISELCMFFIQLGIPLWFLTSVYKSKKTKQYEKQYKDTILSSFVNLYNKDFTYKTEFEEELTYKLNRDYLENKFSRNTIGVDATLNIQNNIFGILDNGIKMNLYDISLRNKIHLENNGFTRLLGEVFFSNSGFDGTYITLDVGKKIPTMIRISENAIIQTIEYDKVELDSSEFEKYFDVNSDDKILATRILTADVMQMLGDFRNKYNIVFEIVLKDNKICMDFYTGHLLKMPIYTSINKEQIYIYYAMLEFTTNLSKEINKALNGIEL